jgi:hypothetical protein
MSNSIPLEWSNIPPGLSQIFPPRVIAARQHQESGAYLAIRTIANAGALIWYAKANYASPPFVIEECGGHEFLDQNLEILFATGDKALKNGPPQCVLDEMSRPPRDRRGKAQKERKEPKEPQNPQDAQGSLERNEPEELQESESPERVPCAAELNAASKTWPEPGSVKRPDITTLQISYDGVRGVWARRSLNDDRFEVHWRYAVHPGVGYYFQGVVFVATFEEAEDLAWQEFANPSIDVVSRLPLVGSLLEAALPS